MRELRLRMATPEIKIKGVQVSKLSMPTREVERVRVITSVSWRCREES